MRYQSIRRAIFSIAVMAAAAMLQCCYLSRRRIGGGGGGNVVIYRRAAMQVINRRHLFYRTARRAHGAVNYRGGNTSYQSIRRAIFSIRQ